MMRASWNFAGLCGALLAAWVAAGSSPASAHDKDYVWPGYGGFTLYHNFNLGKHERPYHRHYYPRRWGGYAFSAPYYVARHDVEKPEYEKLHYGKKPKHRWLKQHRNPDLWDWRHW